MSVWHAKMLTVRKEPNYIKFPGIAKPISTKRVQGKYRGLPEKYGSLAF